MASKKASAVSPVREHSAPASAGVVSGPVAMMTLSHSAGGSRISSRRMSMSGSLSSATVIAAAKPSRSTASAPPAGSLWASAVCSTSEPSRRISAWRRPIALPSGRRSGTSSSRRARQIAPFYARQSDAPGASHAAPRARYDARSARQPRSRQGRRRSRGWVVSYASRSQNRSHGGAEQSAREFCDSRTI